MRIFILLIVFSFGFSASAQQDVVLTKGAVPLLHVFEPDSLAHFQSGIYTIAKAMPSPVTYDPAIKEQANRLREKLKNTPYPAFSPGNKRSGNLPQIASGFAGAHVPGTPNDNNMAINNDSMVVSVWNTYIRVYNTNGVLRKNWGLEFFPSDPKATKPGSGVSSLNRAYDPKVLFDPASNRFIIVFLEGSESSDTRIIVSFSKTSNPLDGWNVYQLNGKPFGGAEWTDYPMIAINNEDLFITVNILKDNTDWRDGFQQSIIWQLPKARGYAADTLKYNLWSNLKHNGKSIWSICPVQDAYQPGEPGLYFLSVRPGDASNDTVFIHRISQNYSHGNPQYSYKIIKADKQYGLPPAASQKQAGFRLQTNDARVLGAYYCNNKIQYVQTCNNNINGRSSVFHGVIQFPASATPSITANVISYDSMDIAYPTIVHAGNNVFGRQSLITFSHSGETVLPGTSVVYFDNNGQYSNVVTARKGDGYINSFIADTSERWGDYTSIQRRYNNPKEFWLVGSFGKSNNTAGTWISQVLMNDPTVGIQTETAISKTDVYPNPVTNFLTLPFELDNAAEVQITVTDAGGRMVFSLKEFQTEGKQKAIINVTDFNSGIYFYTLTIEGKIQTNGSFSKQ